MIYAHICLAIAFLATAIPLVAFCMIHFYGNGISQAISGVLSFLGLGVCFFLLDGWINDHRPFDPYSDVFIVGNENATKNNACMNEHEGAELVVHFGTFTSIVTSFPHTFVEIGGQPLVSVKKNLSGDILFSADIFDANGYIMASIKDNELHVNRNSVFYAESKNKHSVDVFDNKNVKILSFDYMNRREISLIGSLYYGPGMIVDDKALHLPGGNTFFSTCSFNAGKEIVIR